MPPLLFIKLWWCRYRGQLLITCLCKSTLIKITSKESSNGQPPVSVMTESGSSRRNPEKMQLSTSWSSSPACRGIGLAGLRIAMSVMSESGKTTLRCVMPSREQPSWDQLNLGTLAVESTDKEKTFR